MPDSRESPSPTSSQEASIQDDELTVRFDPKVCIHAGECVRGLPSVFDVSRKPWINVNGAPAATIIEQVERCPSALGYELRKDAP